MYLTHLFGLISLQYLQHFAVQYCCHGGRMGLFIHKNTRCRVYTGEGKSGFPGGPKVGPGKGMGSSHSYSKIRSAGGNPYICNNLCSCSGFQRSGLQDGSGESIHKETKVTTRNKLMKKTRISQSWGFTLTCLTQSSSNP